MKRRSQHSQRLLGWALFGLLVGPSLGTLSGCETTCSVDADRSPEVVEDRRTDLEEGTFESVPWDGKWDHFPPKKRYEFRHGLGGTPLHVTTYVGFADPPIGSAGYGNSAEVAGNIVIIEAVTPEYIRVRNDTCETFYLRVAASGPISADSAPTDGANFGGAGAGTTPEVAGARPSLESAGSGGAPNG
jgi:hypothetical protein